MSGLEIPGLAIGGVSFFFQAFAGCIQGYELIADACRLEKTYQNLLIKFKIEEHRLFDWARSIGLDYTDETLVLNHMSKNLIMGILEQQQKLLFSFGRLDKKYAKLASPLLVERHEPFVFDAERQLENGNQAQAGSNAIRFPQTDDLLQKVRKFTEQLKTAPRRLKWASLDKEKAEGLVADLVHFNDKLHEALDKAQRDSLREEQIRTQYQIVLLNRTVENLVQIVQSHRITAPSPYPALLDRADSEYGMVTGRPIARDPHTQPLAALAQFAAVNLQSESSNGIRDVTASFAERIDLNHSADEIQNIQIELADIRTSDNLEDVDEADRTEGTYRDRSVWIEWKVAEPSPGHLNGASGIVHERIKTLAALLKEMNKIVQFRAPECLGYFYDDEQGRYGFVFAKPDFVPADESPTTLRSLLDTDMPPLTDRITLMRLLCETVERLHAVDWLHKGLRSSNILFFQSQTPTGTTTNYADPYISGFEYSRPAMRDDMTQRPSDDPAADIYRHPSTQSGNHSFRKSFDLYSLGVVLLEIAYWQPIDHVLGIPDIHRAKPKETHGARTMLLIDTRFRKYVTGHLGLAVQSVIWSCLQGPEGFGLEGDCDEKDAWVGAKLQWAFGERVVKRLAHMRGL
ncbi:uncharacterized protein EKO05_0004620 [Ascochyta rabiei]|uniref:ATP binding n=1 Tax=Didymella rabiei TaxID=5454 RepID=A0A163EZA2_DIDRA|nr:uncharacterized protein EKO05_0004620 [Ascochyta rabiei]KZM24032.1 ATP binding [Ascochyta rabiei]UPX14129.1 hypothetical protein EKO05_0004620 [Ascochyta rabiei]